MTPHLSERIKNYVEIAAIVIGGIWALYTFVLKDKPSLALRRKATSSLEWKMTRDKNICDAAFNITLENTGSSTFRIKKAHLKAWICDELTLAPGQTAKYVDADNLKRSGIVFFEKTYLYTGNDDIENLGKPFIGRYNEGAIWNESFEFLMKPDPKKIALFYITFYEADHEEEPFEWTYQWDYIGGVDSNENKNAINPEKDQKHLAQK